MTDPETQASFMRACEAYVAACQSWLQHSQDGLAAAAAGPMPLALLGPWKDFAARLGMRADVAAGEQLKAEDLFANLLPGLGCSREYQEIVRRMFDLTVQFHRRCAQFAQQGAEIGRSAVQAIQKRSASDQTILGSPSAMYDAWIDSAEEAYSQAAHSVEFAELLADICNTLSAFKIERGKLLEALARHLDWPSRAEVDSLHLQVRNLTAAAAKGAAAPDTPAKSRARKRAHK
jgi:hypothetical protein